VHADAFGLAEGLLQVLAGFVDGALGVVVGLDGEAVLVDGAVALAGEVEDFADGDVAPDLGPGRLSSPRRASRKALTLAW
jgi:hypothetical protein